MSTYRANDTKNKINEENTHIVNEKNINQ